MGHGDSEGDFQENDIQTQVSDIQCAVSVIKEKCGIDTVGILGLRLGATLAALSEEDKAHSSFMILWEPIINIHNYLKRSLRSNLATQMASYKEIKYTREDMINKFMNGHNVNIDGYEVSASFYKQAMTVDLGKKSIRYSKPVYVAHISNTYSQAASNKINELYQKYYHLNSKTKFEIINERPFWTDLKLYYQISEALYKSTLYWMVQTFE